MKSLAVLPALVVLCGCGIAQVRSGRIDPELSRLVPPDAVMLAGFRMETLRTTPIYQKLIAGRHLTDLDDLAAKTNFDPRKDVREILIASSPASSVMLARGTFAIKPLAGVTQSDYRGAKLFSDRARDLTLGVLDSSTAVAGTGAAVKRAVDQRQSGHHPPAALLERAAALPATGQIWAVTSGWGTWADRSLPNSGNLANLSRIFRSLETTALTADFRSGLDATAEGLCKTDQDAKTLTEALRGFVGLGRLSVPENRPELLRLYDGIKVDQQQRVLHVTVKIPPDLIDQFIKLAEPANPSRSRPAL
jgi:hypothetical protein